MPVAKGKATYRIVHQLEPVTSIYHALAHQVGGAIENARAPIEASVACSYRFVPEDGAFYSTGSGYDRFRQRSRDLAAEYSFAATADISDFYNQIYSHRVRASIEAADGNLEGVAKDLEIVIHAINASASKGIPVGPNASGIIAEGVLLDVDGLLSRLGITHTRYVDDIRMFSNSEQELHSHGKCANYLYEHHRLHFNSYKTNVYLRDEFIEKVLQDHVDDEIEAAMSRIASLDPYGESGLLEPNDIPDEEVIDEIGDMITRRHKDDGFVDLNLIKAYIRRAHLGNSLSYIEVVRNALEIFVPVIHELAKAMNNTIKLRFLGTNFSAG